VGIVQNDWGRPEVVYSARGDRLRRKLGVGDGHVTLTDEDGLIVAVAVLLRSTPATAAAKKKRAPARKAKRPAKRQAVARTGRKRRTWGER
jgi:hypothetical protein